MSTGPEPRLIGRHLRRILGPNWEIETEGSRIRVQHLDRGSPYRPPRRSLAWSELLDRIEQAFAEQGVVRAECLPVRWGRDTDLVVSAVQALDPLLKDGRPVPYRHGFLPQPVVRFTARRNEQGRLREGFLTSFVNISHVRPINGIEEYVQAFDGWLSVLSRLGLHARHITLSGDLAVWRRREVAGVTLRFHHAGTGLGDVVLLWKVEEPQRMAVDLGSGLERLAWARERRPWREMIHGRLAEHVDTDVLDAVRTATLILGQGIAPAPRGPGAAVRRLARSIPFDAAALGVSTACRAFHRYWELCGPLRLGWPQVATPLEHELSSQHGPK